MVEAHENLFPEMPKDETDMHTVMQPLAKVNLIAIKTHVEMSERLTKVENKATKERVA